MKKAGKIALAVAGVVLVAGAVTVAVQWNNIKAVAYMMTMDTGTLSQRAEENRKTLDKAMEDYQIPSYTFSEEEMSQLASGELSQPEPVRQSERPARPERGPGRRDIRPGCRGGAAAAGGHHVCAPGHL